MDLKNNFFLVQQLKSGDNSAYDFLMESFYQKLCSYTYTLTHNHANAEDIVQNVFVEIWINRKNINPEFSIKNYLYRCVYNEFIDQYRKNKPVIYLEKRYLDALNMVVDNEQTNLDDIIKLVNSEINSLPPKCRNIFILNKKEGLTHKEISEHLNISIKTVEGHITRAFKVLSHKLGPKMESIFFLLFDFSKQIGLRS